MAEKYAPDQVLRTIKAASENYRRNVQKASQR